MCVCLSLSFSVACSLLPCAPVPPPAPSITTGQRGEAADPRQGAFPLREPVPLHVRPLLLPHEPRAVGAMCARVGVCVCVCVRPRVWMSGRVCGCVVVLGGGAGRRGAAVVAWGGGMGVLLEPPLPAPASTCCSKPLATLTSPTVRSPTSRGTASPRCHLLRIISVNWCCSHIVPFVVCGAVLLGCSVGVWCAGVECDTSRRAWGSCECCGDA